MSELPGRTPSTGRLIIARPPIWLALLMAGSAALAAQPSLRSKPLPELVKLLFPSASVITPKSGTPPRFGALQLDAGGAEKQVGVAFLTTDLEPLERGYHGPIKILVGLQPNGKLAGVVVLENTEPYGYFSVDVPAFAAQFKGKDIHDPFTVGQDVDAISRASITLNSATRAIRNSARRVAAQVFTDSR
jgi:NosR/NirI family nitrous oxide reductase transcriptional regulator